MSFYKAKTEIMINNLKDSGNLNVVCDFYAQLSNVRPISSLSIINALHAGEMDSSRLIVNSVTIREWMRNITLKDIRNHVVFTVWKEHRTVIEENPYYSSTVASDNYHRCHDPSKPPCLFAEEIGKLLETSFYICQVCAIKEIVEDDFDDLSIIRDPEWDLYHIWLLSSVEKKGLVYTVYENFKLIEPLITCLLYTSPSPRD